jgi:hypothetical protein
MIAVMLGTVGVVAMVVGVFMYLLYRVATYQFDCVLKAQFARQRSADTSPRVWKIANPLLRDIVSRHLAAAQDVLAIATTRCALQSRQHQALAAALVGALLTAGVLLSGIWLPIVRASL